MMEKKTDIKEEMIEKEVIKMIEKEMIVEDTIV